MDARDLVNRRRFTLILLRALVVFPAVLAVAGAGLILQQMFVHRKRPMGWVSELEGHIRWTVIFLALACCICLVCTTVLERRRRRTVAVGGMACALAGMVLGLSETWQWWHWGWWHQSETLILLWSWAVVLALLAAVALAHLPGRSLWVRHATELSMVVFALAVSDLCWSSATGKRANFPTTLVDVAGLFSVCGSVMTAALSRLYLVRARGLAMGERLSVDVTCPRCGLAQSLEVGRERCERCRLRIGIEIDDAHCDTCGYPLFNLPGHRCPECGTAFRRGEGVELAGNEAKGDPNEGLAESRRHAGD